MALEPQLTVATPPSDVLAAHVLRQRYYADCSAPARGVSCLETITACCFPGSEAGWRHHGWGFPVPAEAHRSKYSLRSHLIALSLAALLPMTALAGVLLIRSAEHERVQLEARLIQVAEGLAGDLDRELSNLVTVLTTLVTSPALQSDDLATFHAQAVAAVRGWGSLFLVDPQTLHQVLNSLVPWGTELPKTGDAATVTRVRDTQQPQVSDYFVGVVSKRPTVNVDIPVMRDGKLKYVMLLGLEPDHFLPMLEKQKLNSEWVTALVDRNNVLITRSRGHQQFSGTRYVVLPQANTDTALVRGRDLEGRDVLRAVVKSRISGWSVVASIPVVIAQAPVSSSLAQWAIGASGALVLAIAAAWWFGRALDRPLRAAADAAGALGRGEPLAPLDSAVIEADRIVAALREADVELRQRGEHQRLLLSELTHRVKNVLSVVQALIMRSLSEERSTAEAREVLTKRLQALARAHEFLIRADWRGASLRELVEAELAAFSSRTQVAGPDLMLDAKMVQTFAIVLHELATNAAKHGSLSTDRGRVAVSWTVTGSGTDARFRWRWEEKDGPPVTAPSRKGFGSTLLEGAVVSDQAVKARLSFNSDGFVYELNAPLHVIASGQSL
jgi:two-component sensor histidine kinase